MVSADPTVLTTGLTGLTSSKGELAPVRLAVGEGAGSGLKRGSDADFSLVDAGFVVCLEARLGRVDCATTTDVSKNSTARLINRCKRVVPSIAVIVFGRGLG